MHHSCFNHNHKIIYRRKPEVFSNLPEDAYDFLSVMAGIRNLQLIKQKIETEGGGFDIKEMLRDSRQEGQDEMATLIEKLILSNRISELLKVTTDKEYRNKLLIEYGIA